MEKFKDRLMQMAKPQISELKHQDLLAKAISNSKDKSALSWWWISIPIYIIGAFLMKTIYIPHTTLISNIHEFAEKEKIIALLFFLLLPAFFIIINFTSIRKIYFLLGSPKTIAFLKIVWFNILLIIASVLVIIVYSI